MTIDTQALLEWQSPEGVFRCGHPKSVDNSRRKGVQNGKQRFGCRMCHAQGDARKLDDPVANLRNRQRAKERRGSTQQEKIEALTTALAAAERERDEQVGRLRRIIHRYGDRVPMAMCHRPDWQQEIDEAMEWVARNPEPAALPAKQEK